VYTVSWVSRELGMKPGALRAWEARYGIVHPTRSEGGYRLYDDEDLATLRAMSELVAAGVQPAQAAEQLRAGRARPARPDVRTADSPLGMPDPAILIAASRSYDARAVEDCLDSAFAAARFEYVIDVWLQGALAALGQAWAEGDLNVAQEHFISSAVMRRLSAAFDAAGDARGGRYVVVGLAPGATHEIATLAFATMLRRLGLRVTYLGSNVPVQSWVEAVRTTRPDAALIGAPRETDAAAAAAVVRAVADASLNVPVYIGGAGALRDRALVGDGLAASATWLADTLANRVAEADGLR